MVYGIPVRELQQRLDSSEFAELMIYDRDYGLPDPVRQHEESMALACNLHAPRKGQPWSSEDFSRRPRKPIATDQAQAMARTLARQLGRRRGKDR